MKKLISWATLASFLVFSWSCVIHSWRETHLQSVKQENRGALEISAVQVHSGQRTEFRKNSPARIMGDRVVGMGYGSIVLEKSKIKYPESFKIGLPAQITTTDGVVYQTDRIMRQDPTTVAFGAYIPVSIPLSDVDLVWVKKVDVGATFLLDVALPIGIVALTVLAAGSTMSYQPTYYGDSSCLLVSSHDGTGFVVDAEPYGGAVCRGLQRTEWSRLDHWKEENGQYRIMGSNSLNETQFLDELKVIAVDHSPEMRIVPDIMGKLHTIRDPLPPQVRDNRGRDISRLLSRNDGSFWVSRADGKDPDRDENLKEELILEFPKPAGARQVKIVANAWTTHLGSLAAKFFLGLYGNALPSWYAEVNRHGPAWQKAMAWYLNEELYMLQVRVKTRDGWKSKGVIYGGGPFIAKEKAYPLDIGDVEGDVLRIKLTPAAGFWMIDSITADYTADSAIQAKEIGAARAVDRRGRDLRAEIARADQNYLMMTKTGDLAEFFFDAPPKTPGLTRTLILKASGYYQINLAAAGEPRWDLVDKLYSEPGFTTRYALRELGRWKEASARRLAETQH